ncbi:hypothetical protein ES705_11539 [subsurface metagenome]
MRYRLEIRKDRNNKAKRIVFSMYSIYPRSFGPFIGVIDTGSPRTVLSLADAERLNIPFNNLKSTDPISGYGRGKIPTLKIEKFSVNVKSQDNKLKNLKFPINVVDLPTLKKYGNDTVINTYRIPTLIGLDFLELNNLSIFIDIKNNIAYLED